jgi:MFS family permease
VTHPELERNLRRYRLLAVVGRTYFWVPVTILYAISRFDLAAALRLMAIYYIAVVVAEVPTGWVSDRYGRRLALVAGSACWMGAHASLVLAGDSQWRFALGNVLIAVGFAFRSGTDVAFHYDTLEALGRHHEYEERESRVSRDALVATALCALAGGALASIDLRVPFAVAFAAAATELVLAAGLVDPPQRSAAADDPRPLGAVLGRLTEPLLGWLVVYVVAEVVMEHLVSELGQPYIADTLGDDGDDLGRAALVSGAVLAVVSLVAAVGAGWVPALRRRLGVAGALLALAAVQMGVLTAMAATTAAWVLPLLCLRSLQPVGARILVSAAAAPRVDVTQRATFLSVCSMGGRLAHGGVLLLLAGVDGRQGATRLGLAVAAGLLAVVALTARRAVSASERSRSAASPR